MATSNPSHISSQGNNSKQEPQPRRPIDITKLPVVKTPGDLSTQYVVENGYLLLYIAATGIFSVTTASYKYGLCSLVKSSEIHMVLFDEPSSITKTYVSDTFYTFYELSYIDELPRDKYVPNSPQLTKSLITQLIRRTWNPPGITELLYAIISLHGNVHRIQDLINNNLPIDWGYIDSNGDTFLHKTFIHPHKNVVFLQRIIQSVLNTHKKNLINQSNKAKQTPLALLIRHIYDNISYTVYGDTLKILLTHGAKILPQDVNTQMRRPIMENFTIRQHNHSLVITFNVLLTEFYLDNYSMYAHISNPDSINIIETKYLTPLTKNFSSIFQGNFIQILELNCPEILDYIFGPKYSISKTKINQSQSGESFLNIAAGECNSLLLFEHFIRDITDWNTNNPDGNILNICISKEKYDNFYLLLEKIPLDDLNELLFTPNNHRNTPIYSIMDIPETEKCYQLIINKGCRDQNGNNLAHFAISNEKYDFLRIVIKCSKENTFTHKNKDGFNPLHLAIQKSSIEATLLLLENSDRLILMSLDNSGYNCLHSAIIYFKIDIFKAVLDIVIKCDTVGEEKIINIQTKGIATTPLLLSIEKQCLTATELLLSSGASINIQDSKYQCFPYYIQKFCLGKDSLKKVLELRVNQRNIPTLESECNIEDLNFNKSPLLFYFWQYQHLNRFKEICATFSFRNLVKCNHDGNTILHLSLCNDKLTEYLLELFSDLNDHKKDSISYLDTINKKRETVLSLAVTHSKPESIQKILNLGASLKIEFPDGDNILHIAIRTKNKKIIALFLCHPEIGQLLCKPNDKNETPITSLLKSDGTGAITAITNVGKDIHGPNGESILHLVVQNGDEQTLLESVKLKGISWSNLKDNNKRTPLHYAVVFSKAYAIELLVELGYGIFTPDADNKTVIDYSIEKKSPEIWSIIFPKFRISIESRNIQTSTLKNLLQVCMNKDNEAAFTDLLGLNLCTTFVEQEWRVLIEFSITDSVNTFFLAQIISQLKTRQCIDLYFYPNSNQFTPPLLLAIQCSNIGAIRLMLRENISLSFTRSDKCLTLYSENRSTPLVICTNRQSDALLTGYKIVNSSSAIYVLVNLPKLRNTGVYKHSEVTERKDLSIANLTLILKSSCIEPIKSAIDLPYRYTYNLNKGCTLIHLAAEVASIEVLRYLLYKNSKITVLDKDLNSVLYFALFNEITDIFEFLCNYLVDKLKDFGLFNCENAAGKRILDICIEKRDFSSFCILLNQKYKVKLNYTDSRGHTLFHRLIILKTSVDFFKQLHTRTHSTDVYQRLSSLPVEPSKLTSLHLAISENLHDHIEFMLEQKYDLCVQSKSGSYPIHVAVLKDFEKERINKIINAIPKDKVTLVLNAQNNEGFSPLLLAAKNGNVCTVKTLLERKNIKIDVVDNLGRNALHHSILLKEDEFSLVLLKFFLTYTTLIKQKDSKDLTPLHYCVIQGNVQALELVLQNDKNILNESNEKKNLIHFAIESASISVWNRVFEELKHSENQKSIIETKLNDETILVYCIKKNNLTAFNNILTLTPDIEAVDSVGNTPLHHAAEYPKQSKILTSLIEYTKKHNNDKLEQLFSKQNNDNLTPFHYSIWKNNLSAVDIFIDHKAPFVTEKNSKLTLCALNSPLSINLYSFPPNNQIMIGYKVTPKSPNPPVWILSRIPDMKRDAIKKLVNAKIDRLTDLHIKTILQCPSAEPVIAFLNQNLLQESRKFDRSISLLLYSAIHGTLSVVEELSKTMNPYHIDTNEETILFYALKNEDTKVLTFLLNSVLELSKQKSPYDILNAENKKGERILEVALNNLERFSILLDAKFQIILTYTSANECTLLHTIMRLKRDSKFVLALLTEIQRRKPDYLKIYINISSKDLQTALHLCVCNNLEANLRELLIFSPNITCQDQNENTPLHIASELNFKSIVTILIEHVKSIQGDYPSFINAVNNEKMTPLHLSVISSNLEIAKELLAAGAELYATDNSGKTVLHHAVLIRDEIIREKIINLLFQQENEKANPERKLIQIQDTSNNDSPLHLAVLHSNNRTIKLLLEESPDLTLCDKHKKSVLHQAITKGHLEIIDSILEHIIKAYPKERSDALHVLNLQDEDGNTALHLAINGSRADILKELLPLNPLMNLKNNFGQTPLHLAVSKKSYILNDILEEIDKYKETKESYFYALDNTGLPPLHSAIVNNHLQSVRTLIDSGAGLAWQKNEQHTTLFNNTNGLSLCFCRLKTNIVKKIYNKFTEYNFVGYQMVGNTFWIVALLPDLTQTSVYPIQHIDQLTATLEAKILKSIVKCASIEPIKVGIQKKQIDDQKLDTKGKNWLKKLAISENGHKNVRKFFINHNSSTKDLCEMLTTGVENNDCFDVFEDVVEFIPAIRDVPDSEDEDIREISRTLLEILSLSLENDKIDALKKLLTLNPLLTHLYGENNDSTLLHLMVEKNKSSEFLEEYLEKVKIKEEQNPHTENRIINSKNSNSVTALNLSIKEKQLNNIKTILNYEPNVSSCDASNNSILHFAAKTGNLEIVQLIIGYISNHNSSYFSDHKNSDGCIPLHLATESGNVEICELLLTKGADCYSTDNTSRTVLHHAILIQDVTQRKSMVEFILQNTKDRDNKIVRMQDHQFCIPLQCAVAKRQVSVVELLVPFTDTIKHKNIDEQTALHLSCIQRCNEIVNLIVEQIVEHGDRNVIDYTDKHSKTALHLSIDNKNSHAFEKVLTAKPNLELIDASKNTYLHKAVEVVDDPFFLRTILTNLPEDTIQTLLTRLNIVELPPLQYAILNGNYLAADILVGKGAKLEFQKQGKKRLFGDKNELELKVVEYKSQCWVGFEIQTAKKSHFVITQLPSLEGDTYVSADESSNIKLYKKETIKCVMQQICECKSSDPFNNLLQNGLISPEANFQQIGKFATKEVIRTFFHSNMNALYHQAAGECMIESAVSNPNIDAFEFLLSNLPEFHQIDISSVNQTDSKDAQISLCVKNSLRKSLMNTNTEILKSLLKRFTKINYMYPNEETLIHLAISQGNSPDFLKAIFEKVCTNNTDTDVDGIRLINKQSKDKKQTALHICIAKKQNENLITLLNNSADPFLWDSEANTALHYSVLTNELHFVETIYNATQKNAELLQQTNSDNHSAIDLAVKGENPEIVDFLLRSSSQFYPVMDKQPTLLHLAIRIGNESTQTEIMNQLFKHENAGHVKFPMTRLNDDEGYPPLHLATNLRNNNAVTLLIKTDPSVLYIQDTRGHTPLHISLITSGTKDEDKAYSIFNTIFDNIPAPCGKNLDLPKAQDKDMIIPPLYAKTPCCRFCNVNKVICTQDERKRTAMHYAIQHGRLEAFKQLLTTHSCIFLADEDGYTLHYQAVKNGTDIQFLMLLEKELTTRTGGNHLDCFKFKTVSS